MKKWLSVCALGFLAGCASSSGGNANPNGFSTVEIDPSQKGAVQGTGIEGQDIVGMTNRMARDMIASGFLNGLSQPPRILIDPANFKNEGSQAINRTLITNRLFSELNRASQGRMLFVRAQNTAAVAEQRDLKRAGVTDSGTTGMTKAQAGIDYQLTGTISTLDSRDNARGVTQKYNQILFDLVDAETGISVWSNIYEFTRASGDDVIYR